MNIHSTFAYDKANPHINLSNGRRFYYLDFLGSSIEIGTIAHSLARIPRYGGHALGPQYTVADHSIRVSQELNYDVNLALWGLLHDAAEHVIGDIPTPLKNRLFIQITDQYNMSLTEYEDIILMAVAGAFQLPWPIPEAVHKADAVLFQREILELFDTEYTTIERKPSEVQKAFLDRFDSLIERRQNECNGR